jgi:hypothetical protein
MTSVGSTTPGAADAAAASRSKPDAARPKEPKVPRAERDSDSSNGARAPRVDSAPPRTCKAGRDASGDYCPLP